MEDGGDSGDKLYVDPEYVETDASWGVQVVRDNDGLCFGLSSGTSINNLGRDDLLELRAAIDQALEAGDRLV